RYFKARASKVIHNFNADNFKWQRTFYDRIIRTTDSLQNIQEYIVNNLANWELDENNIKNYSVKDQAGLAPAIIL
ncbi:MAG: hypothetical protein KAJ14_12110, partial [Candidatus Omnitrophica bacterium]|nr:hypothetical protein [Candidatus Omnitrophota bacterium]